MSDNQPQKQGPLSISVFFPCKNEEDNVRPLVNDTVEVLEKLDADYEIIVVDDGSTDRTGEIADEFAEKNPRIKVVHHTEDKGYGAALQSGFRSACKELIFYTDGDRQFDIRELVDIIPMIRDYDIVSCYRINRQDNLLRKINGFCWSRLVNVLFGLRLKDIDCAFKLYKKEIFDNIQMKSTGALIDTEILARAHRKGYTIAQRGVRHYPRTHGKQSGADIKVIIRAFKELFKLYRQINSQETEKQ